MEGLIAKKHGMTQVLDADGHLVAVTVLEVGPCVVVQRKTLDKDGYSAVQVGFGEQKESRITRAAAGRFKKAGTSPKRVLGEFRVGDDEALKAGDTVDASVFEGVGYVDIVGISKGKGFQGVVRRHHMAGGPMTHGGHSKRRIGAVGMRASPGRVLRGHRLPGQMGNVRVTEQSLRVVELRRQDNLLLVRGAVPGPVGAVVSVKKALKKRGAKQGTGGAS